MGYKRIKDVVDASIMDGSDRIYSFRKAPSQTASAGYWFDMSMSPGNPVAKYWFDAPPYTATQIKQSTDGGIFHGASVSPKQKILRELLVSCNSATPLPIISILCDYLLYYPTIDDSVTDVQTMTNNASLPRYTNGEGVMMMAVSVASRVGAKTFTVNYTNSQGVSGRITPNILQNTQTSIGIILNSSTNQAGNTGASSGPFIRLQEGDTGVRSIESVTMNGVDTGLFALVLVKPIATFVISNVNAPVEIDYMKNFSILPEIADDAYLNFVITPQGAVNAATIMGLIKTTFR